MAKKPVPPCPDPERYVWVNRASGGYWKLRRGSVKPAVLNDSFQQNSSAFTITSPATARIRERLEEFTKGLAISNLHNSLNGVLVKTYNATGAVDFSQLKKFEIQEDHPLDKILLTQYQVQQAAHSITIQIKVTEGVVKKYSQLVTDFYFEGILLFGDALIAGGLDVAYAVSKPYAFEDTITDDCRLVLPLPVNMQPWMLLLKVSCLEGNEMAKHPRHYGMRVVEVN
jgi:hypothetical protein